MNFFVVVTKVSLVKVHFLLHEYLLYKGNETVTLVRFIYKMSGKLFSNINFLNIHLNWMTITSTPWIYCISLTPTFVYMIEMCRIAHKREGVPNGTLRYPNLFRHR